VRDDERRAPLQQLFERFFHVALAFVSRLDVASSRITTAGFLRNTRAIAMRWRCPPESFTPRSPTGVEPVGEVG
jgi:hypothetical protein